MKKKSFSYFITPFGVISFTSKFVFINGIKTKSDVKLRLLLQKFDPEKFSNSNLFLYGCFDYFSYRGLLIRFLKSGDYGFRVTEVFDSFCHNASDIFHGQYCDYPFKFKPLPF